VKTEFETSVQPTVLVLDQQKGMFTFYQRLLEPAQFHVRKATDAKEAICHLKAPRPNQQDVLIFDPAGFENWHEIYSTADTTDILVTLDRPTTDSIVKHLNAGAASVIEKPFYSEEIRARISNLISTKYLSSIDDTTLEDNAPKRIRVGSDVTVDFANHIVLINHQMITLSPKEWAILKITAQNPGEVVDWETIKSAVWGDNPPKAGLQAYVWRLRHKLGDDGQNPQTIATVPFKGLKLLGYTA